MYYIGFDIGGTKIKTVLVNNKKVIESKSQNLSDNLDSLLALVCDNFKELSGNLKPEQIGGAGFSLAGVMDIEREIMLKSPNIPCLDNQPIKKLLAQRLDPYLEKIEHDAHCFLLAESKLGQAQG